MNFIGIDLAWTYRNESGICIINETGEIKLCEAKVYSNEQLVDIINEHSSGGALVAIDAPLIVENESGCRKCERELQSNRINGFQVSVRSSSKSFMQSSYRCIRGVELVNSIKQSTSQFIMDTDIWSESHKIIEVYPTGSCSGLFPDIAPIKYKIASKRSFEFSKSEADRFISFIRQNITTYAPVKSFTDFFNQNLNTKSMSKKQYKHFEDKLDAFLCALTAYYCYHNKGQTKIFGNVHEGFIVIPIYAKIHSSL